MRVLIVSKFFYARGGADVVAMTTRDLLLKEGHEVQVFAMSYPQNVSLPESATWPSQIEFDGPLAAKIKAFSRLMGLDDVVNRFRRVLDRFRPDVVHFHNIHSYLSPIVVSMAHDFGVRTVWTVHDLKLVCPAYLGRRPNGALCTDCVDGRMHVMKYRCMKDSRIASFMAWLEALRWNRRKLSNATDVFIAPSLFMKKMLERGHIYGRQGISVLPNFIDPKKLRVILSAPRNENSAEEPFFAYVGRLSAEKGVKTLVLAAKKAGVRLKIAGDGPLRASLEELARNAHVEFLGNLDAERVAELLRDASASVLPSECFENNPLSIIESLCAGTPVIGADIGGIPELIQPGISGEHFISGSVDSLTQALRNFNAAAYDRRTIAREAIWRFSEHEHLFRLLQIYKGKRI